MNLPSVASKRFVSHGQGLWSHVAEQDWDDWRWQLRNRISTPEQLVKLLGLTPEETAGAEKTKTKLAMSITPYFFNLIDRHDLDCPIRRQVIPRIEEMTVMPHESPDPLGEDDHLVAPGLVHRYPDRVLFLVTDRCAAYCRYCTRSRMVSNSQGYDFMPDHSLALEYIRNQTQVRDVLLSGGDPLLFSDEKIESLIRALRDIEHVEIIRIGTRIPIFLPQRITRSLVEMLQKYQPIYVIIHANHPRELTAEVKEACERLADGGIPMANQSVMMAGVNDDANIMKELIQRLLMIRVRPYFVYQMDLIDGSDHLRVPVEKGLEIMRNLRGHTSGLAIPQYVIDTPGGKIPVNPDYVISRTADQIVLQNYEGRAFVYADKNPIRAEPREDKVTRLPVVVTK